MAALPTQDEMLEALKKVQGDLLWLWNQSEVSIELQCRLYTSGMTSVRKFGGYEDSRQNVRAALATDLDLDVAAPPPAGLRARVALAALVGSWEAARDQVKKEGELRADAKVLDIRRPMGSTERKLMLKGLENLYGRLEAVETPSTAYLAQKSEEVENDDPTASMLDEVTSIEDKEEQSLQSMLDSTGGVRVKWKRGKISLPENPEEFRQRMKVEAHTWLMLSIKYTNVFWLRNLQRETFNRYMEYFLSSKVYRMEAQIGGSGSDPQTASLQVPWRAVLNYELACRKWAFKQVRDEGLQLDEALISSVRDSELKQLNLLGPISLGLFSTKRAREEGPGPEAKRRGKGPEERGGKGQGGGQGGGRGKGKGKGGKGGGQGQPGRDPSSRKNFVSYTPDGREICFKFNNQSGCSDADCSRVHVCQVKGCGGAHGATSGECPKRKKGGKQ
jgi:hypothetical protein